MSQRQRIPWIAPSGFLRVGWLLVLALLVVPLAATAQPRPTRPDAPRHFAITGARIVTGTGQVIDDGTVVLNDGVITAVGRNVRVPADAWVVDASGKTVYPGLIDALTNLGHPPARNARAAATPMGPFGFQGQIDPANYSWGPEDRPGTHSATTAADDLDKADARIAQWRNAGFTTVVSALDDGLVTGQAAVLDLGDYERARGMVVATPVAMRLKLQDRTYAGYPQSLLGSFAYLKQLYLDAQYYDRAWAAYESSPKGKQRPEWDGMLEPIRDELRTQYPVLFPADDRKEILRAVATAKVMGVKPIVYGAQSAYEATDVLKEAGMPVVVSLNWPTPPRNGDPEAKPALETLRFWDRAPTTPAELQRAGVAFAFSSGGMDAAGDILGNARKAVELGLSKDAALQAFTMAPARMMGVADRVGSVEVGKIANLVVASGDLFDEGTKIETVFVDGDRFDVPQETVAARGGRGPRGGDTDAAKAVSAPVEMATTDGPYRTDAVILIRGATVMTASHGTLTNADVLIRDGKIAAVGTDLQAPRGAHVVDGTGKFVTPGIIDSHSHIAADAINEGAVNVSSMVTIRDVINPKDPSVYRALAGGVTIANVYHGSANPIGGGNAILKLRWGSDAFDMLMPGTQEDIKFALGENVKRDRNPDRYPGSRMGVQDVIRQAFLQADEYRKVWDAWNAGDHKGVEPRRDLTLEPLADIIRGTRWMHVHAYRADEMLQTMRVAEEFGGHVRSFEHGLEGYKIADELAAHGAGVSTFSDWWAYKVEAYDAIPYNAALMEERGVLVSINSDSEEEMRHLNQEAAKAMKWGGMSEEHALNLVTINPAKQLGIDDRTGSLDVGKDADVVVWDGNPLSMFAKPLQTYVDGVLYFDRDMDRERQEALEKEKAALLERYGSREAGSRAAPDRIAPRAPGAGKEVGR
jgi:imidazolonepropionase-like amidohydrolase